MICRKFSPPIVNDWKSPIVWACPKARRCHMHKGPSKFVLAACFFALIILAQPQVHSQSLSCGLKPLPKLGCRIGRCVDGIWEQVCDANPGLSCGLKPLPKLGCQIGRCVDGYWEQVCNSNPGLSCGLKPLPKLGCRIGRCVDGVWEQVCY